MIKSPFLHNQFLFSIGERFNALNESVEDTVIVSGVPRSGTTWLSEMVAEQPEYKLLSEPLFLRGPGERDKIGLEWRMYMEPNEDDGEVEECCGRHSADVFRGTMSSSLVIFLEGPLSFSQVKKRSQVCSSESYARMD